MSSWISEISSNEIPSVASLLGLEQMRMRSYGPCPSCGERKRGDSDPRGPIGLSANGKGFRCWRCGVTGDLADLVSLKEFGKRVRETDSDQKKRLRDVSHRMGLCGAANERSTPSVLSVAGISRPPSPPKPSPEPVRGASGPFAWRGGLVEDCVASLHDGDGEALDYLIHGRGFSLDIIKEWKLGALVLRGKDGSIYEEWVAIPLMDKSGTPVNVRFRRVPRSCNCGGVEGCKRCKGTGVATKAYRVCAGRPLPLYGADRLSADHNTDIIITEGELDVIAMHHYGIDTDVVSGTSGASANWPDEWLDALEPYRSFTIVYDDDEAGRIGAIKVAEKLGTYRCALARLPENDACSCWENGVNKEDVLMALRQADPLCGVSLKRVDHYGSDIERLIQSPEDLVGRAIGSEKLDKVLGGMRPGLWVLTGETGHGKTTFGTWLCREQAMCGVPVMVTSFEQRPIGTVQKLLRGQMGGDFMKFTSEERKKALYELGQLPIFIMDHYGESTRQQVLDAIRFSVRRHDVKVVLVDHLGFLTRGSGDKERQAIEEVVRDLAIIAVNDGVTIMLVCHPNRTFASQQRRVKISDLKGASAIEQDSHVGIVVERQAPRAERGFPAAKIYVDKVRSEFGSPGAHVLLPFDPLSCLFADTWDETPSGKAGLRPVIPS